MSAETAALARSVRLGTQSEAAVIDRIPQLESVPDDVNPHVDARMRGVFEPDDRVQTWGLCLIEDDTLVEIKSASVVYGEAQRAGRFHFRREQHQHIVDQGGVYLLIVAHPHTRDVLGALFMPPNVVDQEFVHSWIETDGRQPFSKIAWTNFFDEEDLG